MKRSITEQEVPGGYLWIGDPHVASRTPGRRSDDFPVTVINKLRAAMEEANDRNLRPVVLGDLFHSPKESSIAIINEVAQALALADYQPLVVAGNHDKEERELRPGNALSLLWNLGSFTLLAPDTPFDETLVDGTRTRLWGYPHGAAIPDSVERGEADFVFGVTHHDLAFGSNPYPGADPLKPVAGADWMINGHIHLCHELAFFEGTTWFNPGNITRLTLDVAEHIPRVWVWTPNQGVEETYGVTLEHEKDPFDRTGTRIEAADEALINPAELPSDPATTRQPSAFAERLMNTGQFDRQASDEAAFVREDLEAVLFEQEVTEPVARHVRAVVDEALEPAD